MRSIKLKKSGACLRVVTYSVHVRGLRGRPKRKAKIANVYKLCVGRNGRLTKKQVF